MRAWRRAGATERVERRVWTNGHFGVRKTGIGVGWDMLEEGEGSLQPTHSEDAEVINQQKQPEGNPMVKNIASLCSSATDRSNS